MPETPTPHPDDRRPLDPSGHYEAQILEDLSFRGDYPLTDKERADRVTATVDAHRIAQEQAAQQQPTVPTTEQPTAPNAEQEPNPFARLPVETQSDFRAIQSALFSLNEVLFSTTPTPLVVEHMQLEASASHELGTSYRQFTDGSMSAEEFSEVVRRLRKSLEEAVKFYPPKRQG